MKTRLTMPDEKRIEPTSKTTVVTGGEGPKSAPAGREPAKTVGDVEREHLSRAQKAAKRSRDTWHMERGTLFHVDGKPCVVTQVGGDGSTEDGTTLHFAEVNADGTLGRPYHLPPWQFKRKVEEGVAGFIDGGKVHTIVTLPEEWKATAERLAAAAKAAREDRSWVTNERAEVSHPSYGSVVLTRASGHQRLFGSPFRHQHFITFEIHRAVDQRSLSNTRTFHRGLPIIEVRMSEAQFARFITSGGNGEGTPCTLSFVTVQRMP